MLRPLRTLFTLCILAPGPAHPAGCDVASGAKTRALLELYTSEGCSSCPPAEQWVGDIPRTNPAVVPLTLHVPYWDYIGWRDPFSQPVFAARQRWLVQLNHSAAIYTPHFFVSGTEVQNWPQGLLPAIGVINAGPAQATIKLHVGSPGGRVLGVDARISAPQQGQPALFLVVTESGVFSQVARGENAGRAFRHQYLAREWQGPFAVKGGVLNIRRELTLPESYHMANLDVVAFVQDMTSGEILQALTAEKCL
jgi:hypothetical protein